MTSFKVYAFISILDNLFENHLIEILNYYGLHKEDIFTAIQLFLVYCYEKPYNGQSEEYLNISIRRGWGEKKPILALIDGYEQIFEVLRDIIYIIILNSGGNICMC
ncbi:hypothetical protein bmLB2001_000002 [Borrelia miyamotoi]|nr:hypothetical protein [Borrelia miyamotoi]QTL83174.1 hypothetical protein bmLB2001_000002 [Borrelia miyamotoi]WAZ92605.1 hypothetical protein O5402_04305 [Borrelia miyamotoi]WAZ93899.1 hypothetical protein O5399_04315 [Borrelia miyamotoi]WAZ95187.1 hypothetical protein O5397_04305 [Borrelia miyamotoi]WAZ96478.1 hypothetical protein O5405_04305 [Borrelia miyamotoi]